MANKEELRLPAAAKQLRAEKLAAADVRRREEELKRLTARHGAIRASMM